MGLWLSRAIVRSVATVAERRVDLLQRLEVAFDDGLQFVCQRRAFEIVQPSAVFLLQIDQGGHRRGPSFWPRGDAPGRCCGRPGDLPVQLGAAPGLALRWAHRDRTNARAGHAELLLSIVTVTFPRMIRGELANGRGTSRLHSCIRGVWCGPGPDRK